MRVLDSGLVLFEVLRAKDNVILGELKIYCGRR